MGKYLLLGGWKIAGTLKVDGVEWRRMLNQRNNLESERIFYDKIKTISALRCTGTGEIISVFSGYNCNTSGFSRI